MLWLKGVLTVAFAQKLIWDQENAHYRTPHTRLAENKEEGPLRWCPTLPRTKAAGPAEKLRNRLREPSLCSAICRPLCGEPIVSLLCPILSKGFGH